MKKGLQLSKQDSVPGDCRKSHQIPWMSINVDDAVIAHHMWPDLQVFGPMFRILVNFGEGIIPLFYLSVFLFTISEICL